MNKTIANDVWLHNQGLVDFFFCCIWAGVNNNQEELKNLQKHQNE